MKKLIVAALLVIGFSTYAQEETETKKNQIKIPKHNFVFWNFFMLFLFLNIYFMKKSESNNISIEIIYPTGSFLITF